MILGKMQKMKMWFKNNAKARLSQKPKRYDVTVILKYATPLVENRVAHILSFLKSTSFIFLSILFVQYDN